MDHEPVVVTGMGCVSALGHSVEAFWSALQEGVCGLGTLDIPAPSDLKVTVGGTIPAPDPRESLDARRLPMLDRFSVLATVAAGQAIAQSGLPLEACGPRTGCIVGVGTAGAETIDELYRRMFLDGAKRANVFTVPRVMPSAPASQISMMHGIRGPVLTVSSACASSNHAVATAVWLLRNRVIDAAVVGGTEAPLTYGILKAWEALRVLAPDTCRPFDRHRKGLVLAEGAGMFVLERAGHARARGAEILAQIAGVGMSADAADLVAPTLEGPAAAIRACLEDARLAPDGIDYVNAHGTGTVANDITEINVLKSVFGADARRLSISSTKSMHGHALGASGSLELVAVIEAMRHGIVPPTVNIVELDPECDLDVTPGHARERPIRAAISNAFAFGGTNAVIAVTRFPG
ncbi:beta-ketoacyl-[acyl-carrier-protein] synthase family protein [Rhodopila sp.]|uniref:beta-ketoacyl-[acyl-carrier-protein] synthase family protein n=1 Tax=Rhodopila sp. TaxID=2480087 RepID=UPI002C30422D|nr:beta-ketoacyl-[acyl-carrier-protein] synthase family protein [Rhodopila sp.]HVZ10044.1 beta-ketoacyl-[acyl-carrier-protein] synthase family protein [Rhodopila sp.]